MYYINQLLDAMNNKYYLKLSDTRKSYVEFSYFNNTLKLNINFFLNGDYNLPHNVFYLYIMSNIGNIDQMVLNLVEANNKIYHYRAVCNINLNETNLKELDLFLYKLKFTMFLKIDFEIIESINLNLDKFIEDVNKVELNSELEFSNYFPISKLSEFYISEKYLKNYKYLDKIPNDFFIWNNQFQISFPDLWFNRYEKNYDDYSVINQLYYSNLGLGMIKNYVVDLKISIDYYIDNKLKQLEINNNLLFNNQVNNCLYLGINTHYNYSTQELVQVYESGINGIYFPIKTSGNINISFIYNNIKYIDSIVFNYNSDFYSNSNKKLKFTIDKLDSTEGYWYKVGAN